MIISIHYQWMHSLVTGARRRIRTLNSQTRILMLYPVELCGLVREVGLEPTCARRGILRPLCLPVPPQPRGAGLVKPRTLTIAYSPTKRGRPPRHGRSLVFQSQGYPYLCRSHWCGPSPAASGSFSARQIPFLSTAIAGVLGISDLRTPSHSGRNRS